MQPWHYFYYYYFSSNLTIYASPRFCCFVKHQFKWSLQYVFQFANPMTLRCDSKKKCNTFSTLYFAERNWKKMRTSITMNVFCTAASSKYWRMKIDLDFIWCCILFLANFWCNYLATMYPLGKGIAKTSTIYIIDTNYYADFETEILSNIALFLRRESRCRVVNFQAF